MIPTPDPDCNQVQRALTGAMDYTFRCTMPEGHDGHCGVLDFMAHKHRAPIETVTEPFGSIGGRHRGFVGAASGPNRVDAELRRRLQRVQTTGDGLERTVTYKGAAL